MSAFDIRRTARTLSTVENRGNGADEILRDAYRAARYVPVVGIAGPPGAGKSTLADRLAVHWAGRGEKVAVLAVDPSSPFTGGALLGDRVRMDRAASHPNVFVRSLASRGELGGLSNAATDIVMVLGNLGFDRVLLETAGTGQTDIAIGTVADVVVVMAVPGFGDHIQAAKAGILEMGDLYVINKADLPGAATVAGYLESELDIVYPGTAGRNAPRHLDGTTLPGNEGQHRRHGNLVEARGYWRPPVLSISAREGSGIAELVASVDDFFAWSRETGHYSGRVIERLKSQILDVTRDRLMQLCLEAAGKRDINLDPLVAEVASGATSPHEAADRLVEQLIQNRRRSPS